MTECLITDFLFISLFLIARSLFVYLYITLNIIHETILSPAALFLSLQTVYRAQPRAEFKGYVLVSICAAAISSGFRNQANCIGCFNPFPWREAKPVESSLTFKPLEFDRFKIRVVQLLPNAQKFNGAPVAQSIVYDAFIAEGLYHVGQRYIVFPLTREYCDFCTFDVDDPFFHCDL